MTTYQFEYLTIEGTREAADVEAANIVEAMQAFKSDKRVGRRQVMAIRVHHGDEKASELPPLGVIIGDFKRYLDGRMWEELPGGKS